MASSATPDVDSSISRCPICDVEAKFKCSSCKKISYCSAEHQKKHWWQHKFECSLPYVVKYKSAEGKYREVGRYLCAAKDIAKGTILFTETPIAVGPKWNLDEAEQNSTIVPCVGCFEMVPIGRAKCSDCGWPACRSDCPGLNNSQLHSLECPILSVGRGPVSKSDPRALCDYYRTDSLMALKCLVLQLRSPAKWQELMLLESHYDERKNTQYYEDAENRVISYLKRNFLETIKGIEEKSGQSIIPISDTITLHKICGKIEVNGIIVELKNGQEISGVYATGSLFEHSCLPNCYYTFDMTKGFKICFKTGRDVRQGDRLSITYTHTLWGTQMRRDHLKTNKYFLCKCSRCSDPTELGTYLSALKCFGVDSEPCGGYQLPVDPLSEASDWVCNKCPVRISMDQVNFLVGRMGEEVDEIVGTKSTVKKIEALIEKLSPFLHKNHYHMFNLKHSLIQRYGNEQGYKYNVISDNLLQEKVDMCEDLLAIVDVLDPNSFRLPLYTTVILYELQLALMEQCTRKLKAKVPKSDESVQKNYRKSLSSLMRAKSIIQIEIETPQGKQLCEKICDSLKIVEHIMAS